MHFYDNGQPKQKGSIMLFLGLLVVAGAFTLIFMFIDEDWKLKLIVAVVFGLSVLFQFVIPIHFLVPMFMQIGVVGFLGYYFKMN